MAKFLIKKHPFLKEDTLVPHTIILLATHANLIAINNLIRQKKINDVFFETAENLLSYVKADVEYRGKVYKHKALREEIAVCLEKATKHMITAGFKHWETTAKLLKQFVES